MLERGPELFRQRLRLAFYQDCLLARASTMDYAYTRFRHREMRRQKLAQSTIGLAVDSPGRETHLEPVAEGAGKAGGRGAGLHMQFDFDRGHVQILEQEAQQGKRGAFGRGAQQ